MADNIIENLVDRLGALPGIGGKSAKRLAYYILNMPALEVDKLIEALELAKTKVSKCEICGNYSETKICPICSSDSRDKSTIMVVASVKDVDSFENSMAYNGLYFVLDEESLNPLKGIGPKELGEERLKKRLEDDKIEEVVLALNNNIESEQTTLYLKDLCQKAGKKVTRISQGIPVGGVIEYFDPLTIKRAYEGRTKL